MNTYKKHVRLFGKCLVHEFCFGTKIIYQDHFNEIVISLLIIVMHTFGALCFLQPSAQDSIFFVSLFLLFLINIIVYIRQKRTLMFTFYCTVWFLWALYIHDRNKTLLLEKEAFFYLLKNVVNYNYYVTYITLSKISSSNL